MDFLLPFLSADFVGKPAWARWYWARRAAAKTRGHSAAGEYA
ncbi:hypothetical protein [Comamonas sp. SCN 65-56]|nr:hypothetical protein [Comamonas sp. SCN 65-56]